MTGKKNKISTKQHPSQQFQAPDAILLDSSAMSIEQVEEAILNALVAAESMTGLRGLRIHGLPHAPLQSLMRRRALMLEPEAPAALATPPAPRTEVRT